MHLAGRLLAVTLLAILGFPSGVFASPGVRVVVHVESHDSGETRITNHVFSILPKGWREVTTEITKGKEGRPASATTVIWRLDPDQYFLLFPDEKKVLDQTGSKIFETLKQKINEKETIEPNAEDTGQLKKIGGWPCRVFRAASADYCLSVALREKFSASRLPVPYFLASDVRGLALEKNEYQTPSKKNLRVVNTVKEISFQNIDDSMIEVPKDYKIVTWKEQEQKTNEVHVRAASRRCQAGDRRPDSGGNAVREVLERHAHRVDETQD